MKRAICLLLLLAPALAFGQKFQDVSQKGSPASLGIGLDPGDPNPYVFARNNASKGILAIVVAANFKDATGQSLPVSSSQDYAFKFGPLKSGDQRGVAPVDTPLNFKTVATGPNWAVDVIDDHPDPVKLKEATGDGAVLFVQFDDGTTWGDVGAAKRLLDSRPQRLAFLKRLVDTYYEGGEAAFDAALREPKRGSPEFITAACLRSDAEQDKISTIELVRQRFADAQRWHSLGIF